MDELTFITTYFSQPLMLKRQLDEWHHYPRAVQLLLVDDGSETPALPVVEQYASASVLARLRVYRILENIPWARSTARNLAMQEVKTSWAVVADIDHVLVAPCADLLLDFHPDTMRWYRFPRWRRGCADATRNKDALPRTCPYGKIHPHIDSYLIERDLYWDAGGYHEVVFNGVLGGGSEFLQRLSQWAPVGMLPDTIFLEVYTRDIIPDASVTGLSRDTAEYSWRRRQLDAQGNPKPTQVVTLPWERVL